MRVGIVGAGLWARRAHLPAFVHVPGIEIVAISDPDLPRAQQLARDFHVPQAVADFREVLATGIDMISIVAPDDTHHEIASAALRERLPVLCEKPLARTIEEAGDLAALAEAARVPTKIGFIFRYSPALQRLKELVVDGYVGRIHTFVTYSQNPQFMDPEIPLHWKMVRERTGGGVFVEYGSHSLDLSRWIVGELREVCGNARTVVPERLNPSTGRLEQIGVEDVCSWLASFDGLAEGVFHTSWASLAQPWADLAVFGDRGALAWRRTDEQWPFAELLGATTADRVFRPVQIPPRLVEGLEWATSWRECFAGNLVRRFVAEAQGSLPEEGPTFADGLRAQAGLAAIAASLAQRRWVTVPR